MLACDYFYVVAQQMHIQPQAARFQAESTIDGFRVVIPASRNWFSILFFGAWLCGWAVGETRVAGQLLDPVNKPATAFSLFWLICWTLGGIYVFGSILWQFAGREVLTANSLALTYRIEMFGVGVNRSYSASDIKNLRTTEYAVAPNWSQRGTFPPLFGSGRGLIAFDYGTRTIRIGSSLEEAEAKALLTSLLPHLPRQIGD
ncbi:hypothetical protein FHW58_001989 [Duganella sp. 1224]|uniref:hypothetical protein n=1 Tax=Duganella sp. 1224 TaxID=2587052 RepID=UPI0015CE529A|nr:hypothetical protein [Duganella sp. 1224]NYE60837.1 hypothetical protein [Duganella sp. 1224]